jgi:hypothetical protein
MHARSVHRYLRHHHWVYIVLAAGLLFALTRVAGGVEPKKRKKDPGITICGAVRNSDGEAVRRARVGIVKHERGIIIVGTDGMVTALGNSASINVPILSMFSKREAAVSDSATTDENGEFKLANLEEGEYALVAGHKKHGWAIREHIDVTDGQGDSLQITLKPGFTAEVTTPKPRGAFRSPMINVERLPAVTATDESSEPATPKVPIYMQPVPVTGTESVVGPLPAGEKYRISLQTFTGPRKDTVTWRTTVVRAKSGAKKELDFTPQGDRAIKGKLTDRTGKALEDVTVHLVVDADKGIKIGGLTDKKGRYRIEGVPEGKYSLAFIRHEPHDG